MIAPGSIQRLPSRRPGAIAAGLALLALLTIIARPAGAAGYRTVRGDKEKVRFDVPATAPRGAFKEIGEGQRAYVIKVPGAGRLAVTVEPRGDPDATLANELVGAEANARTRYFRKQKVRVVTVNGSRGVVGLEIRGGLQIAHCVTWSRTRQFTLQLEMRSSDPLEHPAWKRLLATFHSDEPGLKSR